MGSTGDKQRQIYDYILKATAQQGYPPSVREIGQAVGLRSSSTVHSYVMRLHEAGLINKERRKTRAISVSAASPHGLPIIGEVTAGQPIYAYEQELGVLPYYPGDGGDYFALAVSGDSMIGAGILDGDFAVVRRQDTANSGDIVVAIMEEEATVKRLHIEDTGIWLLPENPRFDPIFADGCKIVGKVTAVVRELR
ncbi:MAG: transcriptional repressor LexA [Oscillospiraceae bacterium]|nr:transcriptional repressor LexA [Oscillospiraceae bacterium]